MYFSNLILLLLSFGYAAGDCVDLHGEVVTVGVPYIPGPDFCEICVCNNTHNEICKTVDCSPPRKVQKIQFQKCKVLTTISLCCGYVCVDDEFTPRDDTENSGFIFLLTVGVVCCAIGVILLKLVCHKRSASRSRRMNRNLNGNDGSVGFISGSIGYLNFPHRNHQLPIYKPPDCYFPRGEAPPPYDEIFADSSVTTLLNNQVTTVEINEILGTTVVDRIGGMNQMTGESSNTSPGTSRRSSSHRTIPLSLRASPGGVSGGRARSYTMENPTLDDQPLIHRSLPLSASLSSPLPSSSGQIDNSATRSAPSRSVHNIPLTSSSSLKKDCPFIDEDINDPKPDVENTPPKTENVMLRINSDESSDITPSVDDYHSECENCNLNVNGTDSSITDEYTEQETMTLQRNLHDCAHKHLSTGPLIQTLPTNTRAQRYQRSGKWKKKPGSQLSKMPEIPMVENQSENS